MNKLQSVFSNMFLAILSLVVGAIIIEGFANYYLWNVMSEEEFRVFASVNQIKQRYGQDFFVNTPDYELSYTPHHYLGYVTRPNLKSGENIHDSLGFRGEGISIKKDSETFRIVALGASTTYGTSVENYQHAYPYLLEQELQNSGYTVEVLNAGVGGYTSHESIINLQFRILQFDPDLIIVYHGINDIHARIIYPYEAYTSDNSGYRFVGLQDTVQPSLPEYSTALRILGIRQGWFSSQSSIDWRIARPAPTSYFSTFFHSFRANNDPLNVLVEDLTVVDLLKNNPPIYFEENLHAIVAIARQSGAETLLLTPAISRKVPSYVATDPYQEAMLEHHEVIRQVAETSDSFFLDFAAIFPDEEQYFVDGRHMSLEGNLLRAELIAIYLIENGIIP